MKNVKYDYAQILDSQSAKKIVHKIQVLISTLSMARGLQCAFGLQTHCAALFDPSQVPFWFGKWQKLAAAGQALGIT